ncbi:MAG TPA: DinB family protein [Pseudogracilibacillus sp.]|nr:DinB family protein [Pseudogracilibacillus sp.]
MKEADVFQQLDLVRKITLSELDGITEEQADIIPEGFRNNIRWNLGHIYTLQNSLLAHNAGMDLTTPKHYEALFSPGTKPADWEGDLPSLTEIIEKLTDQPAQIKEALSGKLDEPAIKPFIKQNNVGQILTFTFYHEGLHISTIKAFKALTNK